MQVSILDSIPKSKRAYYVKKRTWLPSGSRNDPQILDKVWWYVMRRPVNPRGGKDRFYGIKTKVYKGPFVGDEGKIQAEKIAKIMNEDFHVKFV